MSDASLKFVGRSVPIMAVLGLVLTVGTIVYQAGLLAAKVNSTAIQTIENTADITQLKTDLADIRRGQSEIAKNVDRVLNKLDTLVDRK